MENELKFYNGNQTVTIDLSENDIGTCLLFETHKGVTSVVKRFIDSEYVEKAIKEVAEAERKRVCDEIRKKSEHSNIGSMGRIEKGYYTICGEFLDQIQKGSESDV